MAHEDQGGLFRFSNRFALATVMAISVAMAACGAGGGSAAQSLVSMAGVAVDAPIAGAVITITANAPLNDAGAQTIGTITAGTNGAFTTSVALPASSVPIFANAADPNNPSVILTSYLGQAATLSAAGSLSASNTPDLDITPVTTASLAVYALLNGGSYASISPSAYATTLQNYGSDILAIAAAIKAVGDNLCTPVITVTSTTDLAAVIASQSNLTSGTSTTISTAATVLGGNCPTVLASLPQQISSDPLFGPQLYIGEVNDAPMSSSASGVSAVIAAGTYSLQGLFADTNISTSGVAVAFNPATVFTDAAITVDSLGNVTSTDSRVTGTINGNLITLSVMNGTTAYTLTGKAGAVQAALTSGGGMAYAVQAGGTNLSSGALTTFEAVISPAGVVPVWNGATAPTAATTQHDVTCAAGTFPVRLDVYGQGVGGESFGECITATATSWTFTSPTVSTSYGGDFDNTATTVSLTTPAWTESAQPFILTTATPATLTINGVATAGTLYYVMGTGSAIFATASANALVNIETGGSSTTSSLTLHGGDGTITDSGNTGTGENHTGSTITVGNDNNSNNNDSNNNH